VPSTCRCRRKAPALLRGHHNRLRELYRDRVATGTVKYAHPVTASLAELAAQAPDRKIGRGVCLAFVFSQRRGRVGVKVRGGKGVCTPSDFVTD
jgi:hypothetical protein